MSSTQVDDGCVTVNFLLKIVAATFICFKAAMMISTQPIAGIQIKSEAKGWTTVKLSGEQTVDLLELKAQGVQSLLADVELDVDNYTELRLDISTVVITDANGTHEAKLPSGVLRIKGDMEVTADSTSTATFDFIADESLHITGNGEYILAPVVQLETKENVEVEVSADSKVEIKGGNTKTNVKVGMDVEGNVGVGLKIAKDQNLQIEAGKIKLGLKLELGKGDEQTDINVTGKANMKVEI